MLISRAINFSVGFTEHNLIGPHIIQIYHGSTCISWQLYMDLKNFNVLERTFNIYYELLVLLQVCLLSHFERGFIGLSPKVFQVKLVALFVHENKNCFGSLAFHNNSYKGHSNLIDQHLCIAV